MNKPVFPPRTRLRIQLGEIRLVRGSLPPKPLGLCTDSAPPPPPCPQESHHFAIKYRKELSMCMCFSSPGEEVTPRGSQVRRGPAQAFGSQRPFSWFGVSSHGCCRSKTLQLEDLVSLRLRNKRFCSKAEYQK